MSGVKVILDTNALFLYFQGNLPFKYQINEIGISIITKIEYLVNPHLSPKDFHLFETFESEINVFCLNNQHDDIIRETIKIRKKYKLKLPDAIIAATAIVNDALLINADDVFSKIYNLQFKYIN